MSVTLPVASITMDTVPLVHMCGAPASHACTIKPGNTARATRLMYLDHGTAM